jgi:hypothetical protein
MYVVFSVGAATVAAIWSIANDTSKVERHLREIAELLRDRD